MSHPRAGTLAARQEPFRRKCGGSAAQEGLIYLMSAGLPQGSPSAKLVWLSPEEQGEAKDQSVPCGGFSRCQGSA